MEVVAKSSFEWNLSAGSLNCFDVFFTVCLLTGLRLNVANNLITLAGNLWLMATDGHCQYQKRYDSKVQEI